MKLIALLLLAALGEGFSFAKQALGVPVVPNFTTGSLTSRTETTSKVTETIVSESYNTGWEYSVSGTNIQHDGKSLSPGSTSLNSWTGLDAKDKPNWTIVRPGEAFQFLEVLKNPGLSNVTTIQRVQEVQQITDTISTFSQ
jgi:hypothetical protein|tara:strand:- start:282 stop:704 length:423 start_codon:yes stop_codon:yes gene_type:complete